MIVRMLRHVHSWYCECCGGISDTSLSVEVGTHWTGTYYDDGHFGKSQISDEVVEADIAAALGLAQEYAARCERREQTEEVLSKALDAALENAKTDEERDTAYATYSLQYEEEEFAQWLTLWGHELVEEETYEQEPYEYENWDD